MRGVKFTEATNTPFLWYGYISEKIHWGDKGNHACLYILKFSVKLRSLHFVSPSEKYVSTSCMRKHDNLYGKLTMNSREALLQIQKGCR